VERGETGHVEVKFGKAVVLGVEDRMVVRVEE